MEEEQEYKPNLKPKKATSIHDALKNIDHTLLKKESPTSKKHGKTSLTTLSQNLVRMQLKPAGKERGIVGCANLSNGEEVTKEIEIAVHGLPAMPQLTAQDWRLIDAELLTEGYDNPRVYEVTIESERKWMPRLIQLEAATRPSRFDYVVTRLARLKTIKPTQNMDEQQTAVFFEEIANMLINDGFCYTAIDEGICSLVRQEKDKWFPGPQKLIEYIYPIHWKMKRRKDKLHEVLSRPHRLERNLK